ncbi:MAG TPA: hypothetical protein VGC07_03820 [Granulicella sp.]
MTNHTEKIDVTASFVEYNGYLSRPPLEKWIIPNPFLLAIYPVAARYGSTPKDFSFNGDAKSVGETYLHVGVKSLQIALRIHTERVEIHLANPDWSEVETKIPFCADIRSTVLSVAESELREQEITLGMHLKVDLAKFKTRMRELVSSNLIGEADFYGFNTHSSNKSFVIEKSQRTDSDVFIRITRKHTGNVGFGEMAEILFNDEQSYLQLLDLGVDQ